MLFRTRLVRPLALGIAAAIGPLVCVSAAGAAEATPAPASLRYGTTPVDGCPRFFLGFPLRDVDRCADALADDDWGLSAVTYHNPSSDTFDGAFEPHAVKRWLASDDDGVPSYESETGYVVDKLDAGDHVVTEFQRGRAKACDDLLLHDPHGFSVKNRRAYFIEKASDAASAGCVPGSRFGFIRKASADQDDSTEYVAFVPGDPHTRVAAWPKTDVERQGFEKRAEALGFQRLALATIPDRWGLADGPRYEEEIALGAPPSRYDLLEARLTAARKHFEHVVDLAIDGDTVTILWEKRSAP